MIFSYSIIEQLFLLSMAVLVLFLPGLVWVIWLPGSNRDLVERIADALGITLSIIALFGMFFFFAGWKFSAPLIYLLTAFCLLAILAAFLSGRIQLKWKTALFSFAGCFIACWVHNLAFLPGKNISVTRLG